MTTYPIIANCNYESAEDTTINTIRKAIESGLTDDADLLAAMQCLETTLAECAEQSDELSVRACREAEETVIEAWTDEVRDAVEATRISRYRD